MGEIVVLSESDTMDELVQNFTALLQSCGTLKQITFKTFPDSYRLWSVSEAVFVPNTKFLFWLLRRTFARLDDRSRLTRFCFELKNPFDILFLYYDVPLDETLHWRTGISDNAMPSNLLTCIKNVVIRQPIVQPMPNETHDFIIAPKLYKILADLQSLHLDLHFAELNGYSFSRIQPEFRTMNLKSLTLSSAFIESTDLLCTMIGHCPNLQDLSLVNLVKDAVQYPGVNFSISDLFCELSKCSHIVNFYCENLFIIWSEHFTYASYEPEPVGLGYTRPLLTSQLEDFTAFEAFIVEIISRRQERGFAKDAWLSDFAIKTNLWRTDQATFERYLQDVRSAFFMQSQ